MKKTTSRFWMVAAALVLAMATGACADEPMAVEEPYEVQMDETNGGNCVVVLGKLVCN